MWHGTLTNSKHRHIGVKIIVLWLSNYAKMRFRSRLRLRPADELRTALVGWRGNTYSTPLGARFSSLRRSSLDIFEGRGIRSKYFSLEPCLAAGWRWTRCPVCKILSRFLPFWYCLTPPYKRTRVGATAPSHRVGHCQYATQWGG